MTDRGRADDVEFGPVELRPLDRSDMEQVLALRAVAYGPVGDRDAAAEALAWRMPYSLGAFVGGRLRSMSFMYPFGAYLGGRVVEVGGLAGVATGPEARRRGLVARAVRRWFELLHERSVGFSLEHPFDPTFYARLGYQSVPNGTALEVPMERFAAAARQAPATRATDLLGAEPVTEDQAASLGDVHAVFAERYSFALTRADGVKDHWGMTLRRPWETDPQFAYRLGGAYVVFTTSESEAVGTTLAVRDVAWRDAKGRAAALELLASFEGQADRVRIHLPPGDPLSLDWSAWHTARSPELQLRIVDLGSAIRDLRWARPAQVVLGLTDDDCPWNDGTFELELTPEGGRVRRVTAEADASTSVGALAAIVTGVASPRAALADGRAEGSLAALEAMALPLSGHPVFKPQNDHF